jgi:hypothetical protein
MATGNQQGDSCNAGKRRVRQPNSGEALQRLQNWRARINRDATPALQTFSLESRCGYHKLSFEANIKSSNQPVHVHFIEESAI